MLVAMPKTLGLLLRDAYLAVNALLEPEGRDRRGRAARAIGG
jgi:hypothetical protein